MRISLVQEYWFSQFGSEPKLRLETRLLLRSWRKITVKVETALSNSNDGRMFS
jgi:hypothetical protein